MSDYAWLAFVVTLVTFGSFRRTQLMTVYVAAAFAIAWMVIRAPALLHAVSSARAFGGG